MNLIVIYEKLRTRHGGIARVAELSGRHRNSVRGILKGKMKDSNVVRIATELALEYEREDIQNEKATEKLIGEMKALQTA